MSDLGQHCWKPLLYWKLSTPTRCEFWTNPAYSTFPFDPYLQPGISNNIPLEIKKLWPTMINVCLLDIFKILLHPRTHYNVTVWIIPQEPPGKSNFPLLWHEFFLQRIALNRAKVSNKVRKSFHVKKIIEDRKYVASSVSALGYIIIQSSHLSGQAH